MSERGALALVVGPSGAGKDTILDGARRRLAGDDRFVFARRDITRPAEAGGEDHAPVAWDRFAERRADGVYGLHWEAHGLGYGVPATTLDERHRGNAVVVNVSRGVIAGARERFPPVRVFLIAVPRAVLEQRLRVRGRETPEEVERRLRRADAYRVVGGDVVTVFNDGPVDRSIDSFVAQLMTVPLRSR